MSQLPWAVSITLLPKVSDRFSKRSVTRAWTENKNERSLMMNHSYRWMNGGMGGGMWLWTVIGVLVAVLLVVSIAKMSKTKS